MPNVVALNLDHSKSGLDRSRIDPDKNQTFGAIARNIRVSTHVVVHLNDCFVHRQRFCLEPGAHIGHPRNVSKISADTLSQYERTLRKDPQSKVFAALADAYRELNRWDEAEAMAKDGVERHPEYVGGYLVLSRILILTQRADEAEEFLKKAVQLAPENLLAYQLLGQAYVSLKRPQEALKAHKMVLFLNPMSEKSRQAVEKLETLTALDYDDEVFEMRPLGKSLDAPAPLDTGSGAETGKARSQMRQGDLERSLSLIDALIVRNDLGRAREQLREVSEEFPDSIEVQKRWAYFEEDSAVEEIETLRPDLSRERRTVERKRALLENLLRRIDSIRLDPSQLP